ncbi:glycoside hydrolase [Mytilinidion resinicola]|uniref:Glycoside hydrolase n=1 Tax=Mytilinidion resinicola TaxID=574789 RepID=A0A6A6ZB77_9PEZI|nr:glycoside hydrolase [Mytilinidion resinicola]KAF2817477.1 glycoside hydrolase [Mytilinidion resinicola]
MKNSLLLRTLALCWRNVVAQACTETFTPVTASAFVAALNPGWSLGHTLDATGTEGDWNNPPVLEATFDDVKAAGFKIAYHFTGSSPDWTVDPTWLQRVSDVVNVVTSRGLHTIVNVHHDSWTWADLLAFEPINEPPGTTAEHAAELNKLNNIFIKAINDAGGFNLKRVVTLVGLGEDSVKSSTWFEPPNSSFTNPWPIQYHYYYSPYDFIFSAWGKTTWGSDSDKATLEADIANIRGNSTEVPLLIGEWAASPVATETIGCWNSAYIYHKASTPVTEQSLPFLLNGNTLESGYSSLKKVAASTDYVVVGSNITFKASLLSSFISSSTASGTVTNFTLTFSAGASLVVTVVQWDVPVLGSTTSKAVSGADLAIPITWKGILKSAAARPLQQARTTYANQWNWDSSHVIITASAVADVTPSGKSTTFSIEAYPRVEGNNANYTLTV